MRRFLLALACLSLAGCILNPTNRSDVQSSGITLEGFVAGKGATITLSARDLNVTGAAPSVIKTAVAQSTPSFSPPVSAVPLYYWSTTFTPAANYWSPQQVVVNGQPRALNGLAASAGRIEITGTTSVAPLYTFSATAKSCLVTRLQNGETVTAAGGACADGLSLVLFDNDGVGNVASPPNWPTQWTTDWVGPNPPVGVAWEVGHYQVQGKNVYGLLCRPTSGAGPFKAVVINHGGYGPLDDGALSTYCIGSALGGWVTVMSAYRGEQIILNGAPQIYTSQGNIEVCQGEVTDVLRLTELVRSRSDVDGGRVLMWGHSHGACITERAVQRGAKVKAAAAFSAPTDMYGWYTYCSDNSPCGIALQQSCQMTPGCVDPSLQHQLSVVFGDVVNAVTVTPAQSRVPYDWRSPISYKDDLAARSDVKFLMIQGGSDPLILPRQACALVSAAWGGTSQNFHLDTNNVHRTQPPADCQANAPALTWQPTDVPLGNWTHDRYLVVYDYADHGGVLIGKAWSDFLNWVTYHFP